MKLFCQFIPKPDIVNRSVLIIIFLIISVSGLLYWQTEKKTEEKITDLTVYRQALLVKSVGYSIHEYLESREDDLFFLSSILSSPEFLSKGIFNDVFKKVNGVDKGGIIADIFWVNSGGLIEAAVSEVDEIVYVTDREYFKWGQNPLNKNSVYYSELLESRGGVSEGKKIIIMVTPVWDDDQFLGVVAMTISLENLVTKLKNDLNFSPGSKVILARKENGRIVNLNPTEGSSGGFVYLENMLTADSGLIDVCQRYCRGEKEMKVYTFDNGHTSFNMYLVYSEIFLAGNKQAWILGLGSPKNEVANITWSFHKNIFLMFTVFTLSIVVVTLTFLWNCRYLRRKSYFRGLFDGKSRKKSHL